MIAPAVLATLWLIGGDITGEIGVMNPESPLEEAVIKALGISG